MTDGIRPKCHPLGIPTSGARMNERRTARVIGIKTLAGDVGGRYHHDAHREGVIRPFSPGRPTGETSSCRRRRQSAASDKCWLNPCASPSLFACGLHRPD